MVLCSILGTHCLSPPPFPRSFSCFFVAMLCPPLRLFRHLPFLPHFFGIFPLSSLPSFFLILFRHFHLSFSQSPYPFVHLNPLPDPCHLPNSLSSASLSPFCQFHYHQSSYICDPAGILSRTEAELIDRRLHSIWSPFPSFSPQHSSAVRPLNFTGCFCDALSSSPTALLPQCFVHSAWKDKKLGQIRIVLLITPRASISSIRKCAKNEKRQRKRDERHKKEDMSQGFSSATALFVRSTLRRLLNNGNARERCDPDLLIIYILGWSGSSVSMPFVARLFRRNLEHLAYQSQLERVDSAEKSVFEVISDQLARAVQLISPTSNPFLRSATVPPLPSATLAQSVQQQFDPFSANPRTEQIPLWAILCSMALLSLALIAVLLAHWVGRRISAAHQKKGANRMANGLARGTEMIRRGQEVGGVQKQKASTVTGHSVTFATSSAAGERERGGTERGGGHHQMKGSMMFRQFSRRHQRTRTDGGGAQQQKI